MTDRSMDRDDGLRAAPQGRPLVSVILPLHNGAGHIGEAIESVLAQDYRPVEVIVVDDGSTDNGPSIVGGFGGVRLISQPRRGPGSARNTGIRASSGSLVAFLDQDDLWVRGKLTKQVVYLEAHPEVQFVITRQRMFLAEGETRPYWLKPELLDEPGAGFMPSTLVARREAFDTVGLFDETYTTASDTAWFFLAKDKGVAMAMLPEVLMLKRVHGSNQSFDTVTVNRELLRVARASIQKQGATADTRDPD